MITCFVGWPMALLWGNQAHFSSFINHNQVIYYIHHFCIFDCFCHQRWSNTSEKFSRSRQIITYCVSIQIAPIWNGQAYQANNKKVFTENRKNGVVCFYPWTPHLAWRHFFFLLRSVPKQLRHWCVSKTSLFIGLFQKAFVLLWKHCTLVERFGREKKWMRTLMEGERAPSLLSTQNTYRHKLLLYRSKDTTWSLLHMDYILQLWFSMWLQHTKTTN